MNSDARAQGRAGEGVVVSGRTLLFPVVGRPVTQVQAPAAFNPLFAACGVDAIVIPLELPTEGIVRRVRDLLDSASVGGVLVTVPYKKALLEAADHLSARAEAAGAVNAIRRNADGSLSGDLLDGIGFVAGLRAYGHEPRGRSVLIVGAGGAGAAIAAALLESGVSRLNLLDRDAGVARALAARLQPLAQGADIVVLDALVGLGQNIVINATPLGMRDDDPLPFDPMTLAPATLVVEIIMAPARTRLLAVAAARGCPTHPGRPMLDHQLPAYLDFFAMPEAASEARTRLDRGLEIEPSETTP
jgi:shikimate dehydrogenase